ncbi:MAG: hypothetical protein WAQ08_05785 [Aquabacterium sp.]|uniref:hypothetical protein n=1 Tax=Aquabacterium sp. TaxID=1872578 RepID=UPI003BAECA25
MNPGPQGPEAKALQSAERQRAARSSTLVSVVANIVLTVAQVITGVWESARIRPEIAHKRKSNNELDRYAVPGHPSSTCTEPDCRAVSTTTCEKQSLGAEFSFNSCISSEAPRVSRSPVGLSQAVAA